MRKGYNLSSLRHKNSELHGPNTRRQQTNGQEAKQAADRTLNMCHNTGRVSEKRECLDSATRKKVLFVCSGNSDRSPTAERLFNDWKGKWKTRSAGTNPEPGRNPVTRALIDWADLVLAMESAHKEHICGNLKCNPNKVLVLGIEDQYRRDDPRLINELQRKVPPILEKWDCEQ